MLRGCINCHILRSIQDAMVNSLLLGTICFILYYNVLIRSEHTSIPMKKILTIWLLKSDGAKNCLNLHRTLKALQNSCWLFSWIELIFLTRMQIVACGFRPWVTVFTPGQPINCCPQQYMYSTVKCCQVLVHQYVLFVLAGHCTRNSSLSGNLSDGPDHDWHRYSRPHRVWPN